MFEMSGFNNNPLLFSGLGRVCVGIMRLVRFLQI